MSINEIRKMIDHESRSENAKLSTEIRQELDKMRRLCDRVDTEIYIQETDIEDIENILRQFVYSGEKIYQKSIHLGKNVWQKMESESSNTALEQLLDSRYKVRGNARDGFEITTPMVPKRFTSEPFNQTRLMAEIVHILVRNYVEKNRLDTPVYTQATIHYNACFGDEYSSEKDCPDGDNLDTKHITDALQQILFPADNLLTLSWKITGERVAGPSYMKIIVMDNGQAKKTHFRRQK